MISIQRYPVYRLKKYSAKAWILYMLPVRQLGLVEGIEAAARFPAHLRSVSANALTFDFRLRFRQQHSRDRNPAVHRESVMVENDVASFRPSIRCAPAVCSAVCRFGHAEFNDLSLISSYTRRFPVLTGKDTAAHNAPLQYVGCLFRRSSSFSGQLFNFTFTY